MASAQQIKRFNKLSPKLRATLRSWWGLSGGSSKIYVRTPRPATKRRSRNFKRR